MEKSINAAWIPNSKIAKISLTKELLHPEGPTQSMNPFLKNLSLLVLNRDYKEETSADESERILPKTEPSHSSSAFRKI
ncbi:hypothetical protein JWG45_05535 [Leptospira sp. 201903070]|uniref:Uncharacterized protein n=1 Tax=Leptospira ainlahdjerensis TaxID=2810033 RepID=A0ABS2U9J3_9LEPT|nr:hypothetical protein [Leptospira ainlahdjerensis]MBM9576613.1 hypothetical protein [Leptospira ainlahdjerensis]